MRKFRCVPFVVLLLLIWPARASAQRQQFYEALIPFYRALAGVYGDEGPELQIRLDAIAAVVKRWDDAIRTAEAQLHTQLSTADPPAAQQVHTALASVYAARNRFDEALREVETNLGLNSSRSEFHRGKGLFLLAADRPADATDAFRDAWVLDRADPQNAYRLIIHRSVRTTDDEIAEALTTLATLERAVLRGERNRADAAFFTLNAIKHDVGGEMTFAPAAYARALSLLLDGRFEAGIAALRDVAAVDPLIANPGSRPDSLARGIKGLRQGNVAEAIEHLEAAVTRAPESSEAHRLLATAYHAHGDDVRSVQQYRAAVQLNPHDERSWVALVNVLRESSQLDEAGEALLKATAALPESGTLRWLRAVTSLQGGKPGDGDMEIIAMAERLVMLAGSSDLYARVAQLAQMELQFVRALDLLQRRAVLTPNDPEAHKGLGTAYIQQGMNDAGYAELVIALQLGPADVETLTALGRLHITEGRYERAVDVLEHAVKRAPSSDVAVRALGDALVRLGRTAEGHRRLRDAEDLQANRVEQQRRVRQAAAAAVEAEHLMKERQYERAAAVWQRVIDLRGRNADLSLRLADALAGANQPAAALSAIQDAIALSATPAAYRRLAEVYAALGREQDSARARQTYLELRQRQVLPAPALGTR